MTDGVDLSISQFRDAWRVFCAPCPGAAFGSGEGVEFLFSGLPIGFYNVAIVTGRGVSAQLLQARARAARDWASDKGVPWLFLVTHEALGPGVDATAALEESGLVPVLPLTGMVADRVPQASVPRGLTLAVPHDEAGYGAFFDLNGAAYGMDLGACYERMGYDTVSTHTAYLEVKPGDAHSST